MTEIKKLFDLDGRTAIVTGGKRGLGFAIAKGLAEFGANIVIADMSADGVEEITRTLSKNGRGALFVQADISRKEDVDKVISQSIDTFGKIDILFNNAGISHRAAAVDFTQEDFERVLSVNLMGVFLCSQAAARRMIEQETGGSIINMSSISGIVGLPHTIAYSTSKGGVTQMTKSLALEWAPFGIRVNAIAPCPFETQLAKKTFEAQPELYEDLVQKIPLGRPGVPEEIIGAAIFLASDASKMVTGHILSVDGGWVAQ